MYAQQVKAMERRMGEEKKLRELKSKMEFNGKAWFNYNAFMNETNEPCYIPMNAEDTSEIFTYADLTKEVENWKNDNNAYYFVENEITVRQLVDRMFTQLEWIFPSTWLDQLDY